MFPLELVKLTALPNSVDRECGEANSMKKRIESSEHPDQSEHPPHRVRLPRFITDEEIGFGDVIKRTTSYFGIQPCGGCGRRAAALNRWLVFANRKSK
jgi:hypothetical protein